VTETETMRAMLFDAVQASADDERSEEDEDA
jgi:hypothetical protein